MSFHLHHYIVCVADRILNLNYVFWPPSSMFEHYYLACWVQLMITFAPNEAISANCNKWIWHYKCFRLQTMYVTRYSMYMMKSNGSKGCDLVLRSVGSLPILPLCWQLPVYTSLSASANVTRYTTDYALIKRQKIWSVQNYFTSIKDL